MWATKPINQRVINSVVISGESHNYWFQNNTNLINQGLPPSVTHVDMSTTDQMTRHIYGKQAHDGCIMFGGHRKVE